MYIKVVIYFRVYKSGDAMNLRVQFVQREIITYK